MSTVRLPHGVRDYLPAAAAQRRLIAERLLSTFEAWGYRRIITPAFEYESVLARGLGEARQAVKFVEPLSGEIVALRPDITPQVARLVATRLADEPGPIRLAYEGAVVRMGSGAAPQRELFQAGVELVDAPSPAGDVEVIALGAAALAAAGVSSLALDLGEVSVARSALAGITDGALRQAIARKDVDAVARSAKALDLPRGRRRLLEALPSLYGGPEVIEHAASLLGRGDREARAGLATLATVIARLAAWKLAGPVSIDLGEVRGFDYYTGVRFQGFAPGVGEALLSGGRYDRLIERYGRKARAAGFAVDVERVALGLRALGAPLTPSSRGVYLVGAVERRQLVAAALRRAGVRVGEELDELAVAGDEVRFAARALAADLDLVLVLDGRAARWRDRRARTGRIGAARLGDFIAGRVPLDALLPAS